ncbi:hypothetical protein FHW58_003662 [Duganella sp. 1224]|uniref:toll-Interleukin receptor n=1 Tax=Duganella sp. 1224 TaxID=2587052 RepID=UPI0015CDC4EC|nr:toll-Interleukin receptor [Duganella sp. 1224]NYE62447.1 hypothetical protein [Duganella sp. 1224]
MKVFLSWSGDRSREVAKLLDYWVKCVVQASRPWISTSGIDSGSIWFNQISSELQDTTFGIICLTKENKEAPWILFEAGALAKGLASSRVCTFLIDVQTKDIRDPLAQFNHTLPNPESMWKLISTLNGSLPEPNRLDVAILKGVFETYWPQFEAKFAAILKTYPETTVVEPRKQEDILTEILESTRGLERRMREIENTRSDNNSFRHVFPRAVNGDSVVVGDMWTQAREPDLNEVVSLVRSMQAKGTPRGAIVELLVAQLGVSIKKAEDLITLALRKKQRPSDDGQPAN